MAILTLWNPNFIQQIEAWGLLGVPAYSCVWFLLKMVHHVRMRLLEHRIYRQGAL